MNNYQLTDYQFKVCDTINDKLIDFAMTEAHSIYNIEILYHHNIEEISTLFHKPTEHYSKILKLAYDKTIKEYQQ